MEADVRRRQMRRVRWGVVVAALVVVGGGCGGSADQSRTAQTAMSNNAMTGAAAGELWGRRFAAVSFERKGAHPAVVRVPNTRFWFTRHRGRHGIQETINWDDGCNGFGGWMRVRGSSMRVWNVAGTLVACVSVGKDGKPKMGGGPILMNFFLGRLHWHLDGTHLAITKGSKTLRLRDTTGSS
jgi:hypothetical protein